MTQTIRIELLRPGQNGLKSYGPLKKIEMSQFKSYDQYSSDWNVTDSNLMTNRIRIEMSRIEMSWPTHTDWNVVGARGHHTCPRPWKISCSNNMSSDISIPFFRLEWRTAFALLEPTSFVVAASSSCRAKISVLQGKRCRLALSSEAPTACFATILLQVDYISNTMFSAIKFLWVIHHSEDDKPCDLHILVWRYTLNGSFTFLPKIDQVNLASFLHSKPCKLYEYLF